MELREVVHSLPQWVIDILRRDPVEGQMLCLAYRGDTLIGKILILCDHLDALDYSQVATSAYKGLCYTTTKQRNGGYVPYVCDHCKQGKPSGWLFYYRNGRIAMCDGCVFTH